MPVRALNGAAVVLVSVALFVAPVLHRAFLRSFIYQMDVLTEKKDIQQNGIVLLVDMTKTSYSNVDFNLAMKVYNMVSGAYPAKLKNILIVDAPLWFRAAFRTISTVFRRKITDRVSFVSSTAELASLIGGRHILPSHLGGTAKVDHHAWFEECLLWHPDSSTVDVPRTLRQATGATNSPNSRNKGSRASNGSLNIKGLTIAIVQAHQPNKSRLDTDDSESDKEDASKIALRFRNGDSSNGDEDMGYFQPNELVDYIIRIGESGIRHEYMKLRGSPLAGSCSICKRPENLGKNRYTDVPCYDHSRVGLNLNGGDGDSDYIHANFVSLPYQPASLILTQGPLESTIGDFWSMVWQYDVKVIVMTTKLQERGRVKCSAYWPSASGAQLICQRFIISAMSVDVSNTNWTISNLSVVDTISGTERTVFHLYYHGWPDFG